MAGNKVFCELWCTYFDDLLSCSSFITDSFRSQYTDWNILNSNQAKEIAIKVPTNKEELAECMLPEKFQKEYGDRLLKNINHYIQQEKLQKCIEDRQAKKRKTDNASNDNNVIVVDDEFDDGIDYAAIELPATQNSGEPSASSSSTSKLKSKKSSYFPKA